MHQPLTKKQRQCGAERLGNCLFSLSAAPTAVQSLLRREILCPCFKKKKKKWGVGGGKGLRLPRAKRREQCWGLEWQDGGGRGVLWRFWKGNGAWWLDEKALSQTFWKALAAYPRPHSRMGGEGKKRKKMTPRLAKTHRGNQRTAECVDGVHYIIIYYVYEIK